MNRSFGSPAGDSRRTARPFSLSFVVCTLGLFFFAPTADARAIWKFPCTTGYVGAGAVGGVALAYSSDQFIAGGALAINDPGNDGRDEVIMRNAIAGGLAAAGLLQWALDSRLHPAPVVSRTGAGEGPLAVGLAFAW